MDYIAGSFYDGFVLYAKALEETLADGGAQNDGINITMRTQNRRLWGERMSAKLCSKHLCLTVQTAACAPFHGHSTNAPHLVLMCVCVCLTY